MLDERTEKTVASAKIRGNLLLWFMGIAVATLGITAPHTANVRKTLAVAAADLQRAADEVASAAGQIASSCQDLVEGASRPRRARQLSKATGT